jgi:hypothetical protein
MAWPSRGRDAATRRTRYVLDGAATAGLIVIGVMIWRVGEYSPFSYQGGLVVLSFATAAVVAATAVPGCLVGRALGWRPLRWIGVRSYGIYLWHYPVIVLTTPASGVIGLPRAAGQIAASVALAALSWKFVEEPIRHGAIQRLWERGKASKWRISSVGPRAAAATTGAVGVLALACAGLAGFFPVSAATLTDSSTLPAASGPGGAGPAGAAQPLPLPKVTVQGATPSPGPSGASTAARTSCSSVVHIGDSTSEGMILPSYLPRGSERLAAQYHRVGVSRVIPEISGARSIVEVLPGQVNAYNVARGLVSRGYQGCWVLALGTNDTANVAVGSSVGLTARISQMMSVAHGEPVLWVNVKSLLSTGPYAEPNMIKWNQALLRACARYPNMRVFNWASVARRSWFISDGIHYTSAGYLARGHLIARALAEAFPASGQSTGCVVG